MSLCSRGPGQKHIQGMDLAETVHKCADKDSELE